jgi:hypothetical protein
MKIRLSTVLDCPNDEFIAHLQSTASFRFITWPVLIFEPQSGVWPDLWPEDSRGVFRFRLFGILPLGSQQINISNPSHGIASDGSVVLRDDGQGTLMQRWDHWITATPRGDQQTHYIDEVELRSRYLPWALTPLCA